MSYYQDRVEFAQLLGKTLISAQGAAGEDEMVFTTSTGDRYTLYHEQDCCESVSLQDIAGDLEDLIGSPILLAEEVIGDTPVDYKFEYEPESYTWTFYKLATLKGYVTLRWLGESNGYYSESVDFRLSPTPCA